MSFVVASVWDRASTRAPSPWPCSREVAVRTSEALRGSGRGHAPVPLGRACSGLRLATLAASVGGQLMPKGAGRGPVKKKRKRPLGAPAAEELPDIGTIGDL